VKNKMITRAKRLWCLI